MRKKRNVVKKAEPWEKVKFCDTPLSGKRGLNGCGWFVLDVEILGWNWL